MRTYYFCTDTAKDMESWMKVMNDATLVHANLIKRCVCVCVCACVFVLVFVWVGA